MKTLQSLSQKQSKALFQFCLKISILIAITSLTACTTASTGKKFSSVDFEPCSLADSANPITHEEFSRAFTACLQKAHSGDPISQKNLAYIYYYGNAHVPKDVEASARWFNVAASQGNAAAIARVQDMGMGTAYSFNYYQ